MASIHFTLRDKHLSGNKFTGTLEVSGKDFFGNDYRHEGHIELSSRKEWDIPVGPCSMHIAFWMESATRVCVDGLLQCGPARHPSSAPSCFDVS